MIVAHYRASREWLMPSDVVNGVKRLRTARLSDAVFDPPSNADPDNVAGYLRWLAEQRRMRADGEVVVEDATPELPARDVVAELGQVGRDVDAAGRVRAAVREGRAEWTAAQKPEPEPLPEVAEGGPAADAGRRSGGGAGGRDERRRRGGGGMSGTSSDRIWRRRIRHSLVRTHGDHVTMADLRARRAMAVAMQQSLTVATAGRRLADDADAVLDDCDPRPTNGWCRNPIGPRLGSSRRCSRSVRAQSNDSAATVADVPVSFAMASQDWTEPRLGDPLLIHASASGSASSDRRHAPIPRPARA